MRNSHRIHLIKSDQHHEQRMSLSGGAASESSIYENKRMQYFESFSQHIVLIYTVVVSFWPQSVHTWFSLVGFEATQTVHTTKINRWNKGPSSVLPADPPTSHTELMSLTPQTVISVTVTESAQ